MVRNTVERRAHSGSHSLPCLFPPSARQSAQRSPQRCPRTREDGRRTSFFPDLTENLGQAELALLAGDLGPAAGFAKKVAKFVGQRPGIPGFDRGQGLVAFLDQVFGETDRSLRLMPGTIPAQPPHDFHKLTKGFSHFATFRVTHEPQV